jgi:phosphatidylserine/phosphatidylglycerophosphate/cardiolipin synthase-like enzyme
VSADLPRSVASSSNTVSADREPLPTPPRRPRWRRVLFIALRIALFGIALLALRHEIAGVEGVDVLRALRSYGWPRIVLALTCTAASFLTLGAMEVVALRATGGDAARTIPRRAAVATAFVAHALSQSVGFALLTGAGVRLRSYARYDADARAVARITTIVTAAVTFTLLSLGALVLLGSAAPMRVGQLAIPGWSAGALLALVAVFVGAVVVRGRPRLTMPPPRIAAALVGLSTLDWLLTGAVYSALVPAGASASWLAIFRAFVLAHGAGAVSHVPGGAGVLDVTLLSQLAAGTTSTMRGALAASIVAYRVVYYLVPLCAAMTIGALVEIRRTRRPNEVRGVTRTLPFYARPNSGRLTLERAHADGGSARKLEWLIDNADAYDSLLDAIRTARRSVWISQLAFDADCVIYSRDAGSPTGASETVLAETLVARAATASLDVRILLNEHFLQNTLRAFRRYLGDAASTIRVRGVQRFPHFLHVKMVIVDGKDAFLLGSPFVNSYWDDARHAPSDARRPNRELSGRPLHDVSLRIGGPVVRQFESVFADLWNDAAPAHTPDAPTDAPLRPAPARRHRGRRDDALHLARTLPRRVMPNEPDGATEVLEALLDGIAQARSLIYIEHQYLTARPAVAALVSALRREPDLEVVIVVNQNPDLTAYRGWQNARLAESGLLTHPRVGVFTLWSAAPCGPRPGVAEINQVFVHSKVITIDDRWALVGAANLDGLSLHSYGDDFTWRAARRIFRHVRNFEVSLVVRDDDVVTGSVADLRTRLWAEHLGITPSSAVARPANGWLATWRAHAVNNVRTLNPGADRACTGPSMRGFVLPYSMRATPARQLADIGVRVNPEQLHVRFDPGWMEVHLSLAWVRNIFA